VAECVVAITAGLAGLLAVEEGEAAPDKGPVGLQGAFQAGLELGL
jgi:hypothetical protein